MDACIIEPIEESEWISLIVLQDKNTMGEVCIWVELRKLDDACLHDPFLTPFTDEVLEIVGGQEIYSFTDGFYGYHHIQITNKDQHKTTFAIEWGCFQYTIMAFGLKNAPSIFSRIVVDAFKYFIHNFLEVYFDDWDIFGLIMNHIESLEITSEHCRRYEISLNLKKCIFCTSFGIFWAICSVAMEFWSILLKL